LKTLDKEGDIAVHTVPSSDGSLSGAHLLHELAQSNYAIRFIT
jgi:hypothetical protein